MRFGKKGKLSPRFFEILRHVEEVAYELALPPSLAGVHPIFHVSMLWRYYSDPSHVLDFSSVQLDKDLSYVEKPVAILDRQVRKLGSKNIASVKVQWQGQPVEEATWETEQDMRSHYPHLFTTSAEGIQVDPKKIKAVKNWPRPTSATEIKSFLGLVKYEHQRPGGLLQ
ncbi:uncharacterized protein [Nicotiana sylvestris]|uniref:uncharacterized protein n=1 Tax=Nicotiana sylvestris TaxID=4096 RepID=UPI00388C741C